MVEYVYLAMKLSCCSTQMGWPLLSPDAKKNKPLHRPIVSYCCIWSGVIAKLDQFPSWSSRSDEWNKRAVSV